MVKKTFTQLNFGSQLFFGILLLLGFVFLFKIYLNTGLPSTHDGNNHLIRFANYKLALKELQFPPRWAPNLLNHYGYPVFNFNYPLANILSIPFSIFKISYELTFKIITLASFIFGLIGLRNWLRLLKVKNNIIYLALTSYLINPYVINLLYFRGNIGEIMALNLFIWLMYLTELIKHQHNFHHQHNLWLGICLFSLFLISHNVTVLFGIPIIFSYGLAKKLSVRQFLTLSKYLIFGIGFSLWFWLPALLEKNQTILNNADLSLLYLQYFPTFNQLINSPLSFGFSYASPVDGLSASIGSLLVVVLVLFFINLLANLITKHKIKISQQLTVILGMIFVFTLLQFRMTAAIWQLIPLANFIQFPWRLSLFIAALFPVAFSLIVPKNQLILRASIVIIIWQLIILSKLQPISYSTASNEVYDTSIETTSTISENMSKTFTYDYFQNNELNLDIIEGQGKVLINNWQGSRRKYDLFLTQKSLIVEPTMNFSGWETYANQQKITYTDSKIIGGRIAYWLDKGDYHIETRFTQNTWPRKIGNTVFIITAFITSYFIIKQWPHKNF